MLSARRALDFLFGAVGDVFPQSPASRLVRRRGLPPLDCSLSVDRPSDPGNLAPPAERLSLSLRHSTLSDRRCSHSWRRAAAVRHRRAGPRLSARSSQRVPRPVAATPHYFGIVVAGCRCALVSALSRRCQCRVSACQLLLRGRATAALRDSVSWGVGLLREAAT